MITASSNVNHFFRKEVFYSMDAFIKKYEYNFIKNCLSDLNNTLRTCIDQKVIATNREYLNGKILGLFPTLSEEQKNLLNITHITDPLQIEKYLDILDPYVYGMPAISNSQISKLFKKEKKLKSPTPTDSKKVYLGWIDESTRKLFLAYHLDGKPIGMACRLPNATSNNVNKCTFCNHVGKDDEVAFVSPVCKSSSTDINAYRSIGFYMCLDSEKCNERITSVENLEKILKNVNNISET